MSNLEKQIILVILIGKEEPSNVTCTCFFFITLFLYILRRVSLVPLSITELLMESQ